MTRLEQLDFGKWRKWEEAYLTLRDARESLKGIQIEELFVVNGAHRLNSCLDE